MKTEERFVVDELGNRQAVLVSIDRYAQLLESQEELESIRAFDAAKAAGDEAIPFSQAIREIRAERK